ncbi:MAG: hypothetical protein F6J97_10965 [Leptolyngbya sp. SIO4C1]|nr:hypothetical protein [Leptolyngbya sp. SIO4C1]
MNFAEIGLGVWHRAYKYKTIDAQRFFALSALPWFCSAPIVLVFSLLGLQNLFQYFQQPQSYGTVTYIFLLATACILWATGKRRHRQAQNPLQAASSKRLYDNIKEHRRTTENRGRRKEGE